MAQPVRVCNLFVSWLVARRDEAELRHPAGVDDFLPFQTADAPHAQQCAPAADRRSSGLRSPAPIAADPDDSPERRRGRPRATGRRQSLQGDGSEGWTRRRRRDPALRDRLQDRPAPRPDRRPPAEPGPRAWNPGRRSNASGHPAETGPADDRPRTGPNPGWSSPVERPPRPGTGRVGDAGRRAPRRDGEHEDQGRSAPSEVKDGASLHVWR